MLAAENISEYVPVPAADVQGGDYFYMEALTRMSKDWELYW